MDLDGNVSIEDSYGESVTRIDSDIRPVGSNLAAREEHPNDITLTQKDAAKLGVILERM